ncbi:MAG: TrkH family potassium uptake protein [Gammaproteobacteria bacterium]|nr:TrkH family potassium uptake protein [Gammaproteobacteria bacterium]
MKFSVVQRILGVLLMGFSITMLPPMLVSFYYADSGSLPFYLSFLTSLLLGLAIWFPVRNDRRELQAREGFMVVTMFWVVLGLFAALPFLLAMQPHLTWTEAVFEAVSGLTTTGATVLTGIDELPASILWYRQQLQWIGGLAVVVIALAILPLLGVGGMQLYRSETSGPSKHDKLLPRVRKMTSSFLGVYVAITLACALAYWLAGMSGFDAAAHALSTVSTGGFSTHDASMAYFGSSMIEGVAIVFMIIGGISFGLHFAAIHNRTLREYWRNAECRAFLLALLAVALVAMLYLMFRDEHDSLGKAFMAAAFQVVAVMTTTGFSTDDFSTWPAFLPVLLMFISIMGASGGSTGGGMKVVRFQLLFKQGVREVERVIHPQAEIPVKLGKRVVPDRVIEAVWGFFATYTFVYVILMLLFLATGMDQVSAFSAVAATLNNLGPGLGDVASNFTQTTDFAKWVGVAGMLLGRLEIFTLLVLLTPEFWRH